MSIDQLSKPHKARQLESNERYLAFLLGKEEYAIPLLQVKEVIEMSDPTPVPQTPPYLKGIINLRGQVISVLDLRAKLDLKQIENGPKTAIIILDIEPQLCLGVIVDRINSVMAFHPDDMSPPPETLSATGNQYLTNIARREKRMTMILDIRAALSLEDLGLIKRSEPKVA